MEDKNKKASKEEDDTENFLAELLDKYKKENPNLSDEEFESAKKLITMLDEKVNNRKPVKTLLIELVKSLLIYFASFLTVAGLMNSFIVIEPFSFVFLVVLILSGSMMVIRLILSLFTNKFGNPFLIDSIGAGILLFGFGLVNTFYFRVFDSGVSLFMYFLFAEIFAQLIRLVLMRKILMNLWR